jgi:hypothetical protein
MINTAGSMAGYFLVAPLAKHLPQKEKIRAMQEMKSVQVSVLRRVLAAFVDGLVFLIVYEVLPLPALPSFAFAILIVYILPELIFAKTLGLGFLRMKLETFDGEKVTPMKILTRNFSGIFLVSVSLFVEIFLLGQTGVVPQSQLGFYFFGSIFFGAFILLMVIAMLAILILKRGKFWFELLSDTTLVSTFKK